MSEINTFSRKYRPTRLGDYVGNDDMKKSVMRALNSENIPQIILMQGHAGCGKTTMARLIAKEILCEDRSERTGACNKCTMCEFVDEYIRTGVNDSIPNIREYDIGRANTVEDVNALLEEAETPVFGGGKTIYILDEVHNMSKQAQTRLLKTFEEPPEHVIFILCTTNPEKVLDTIRSRCDYKFKVRKPKREEICALLGKVCTEEGVKYDKKGLSLIAANSDFVMRDALKLLEQVHREAGSCTIDKVTGVLNCIADEFYFEFYNALLHRKDIYKYITFISKVKRSMDMSQFLDGLLAFSMRGIYVCNGIVDVDMDLEEIKQYKGVFDSFNGEEIADLLTKLLKMKDNVSNAEAELLLLGYTGLCAKRVSDTADLTVKDDGNAAREAGVSRANYMQSRQMTEEQKQNIVEEHTKELDTNAIAEIFGGVSVVTDL